MRKFTVGAIVLWRPVGQAKDGAQKGRRVATFRALGSGRVFVSVPTGTQTLAFT
ncbi:MAG: hypothetical protein HN916_08005 [Anaerolineae bacterium]|nr:hypothetical protein [Anaerolineae bacterium]